MEQFAIKPLIAEPSAPRPSDISFTNQALLMVIVVILPRCSSPGVKPTRLVPTRGQSMAEKSSRIRRQHDPFGDRRTG
jgi:hypothetical protein